MCCESGINTVLPRCFSFTGPYLNRNIHFAIGYFIRDALAGNEIIIQGDGMPLRSYLYADDLVEWLFRILECGRSGEAYNVGSDEAVSIADLARRVKRLLGSSGEVLIQGEKQSQLGANRYIPDIGRAQKELNLQVRTSLDEAILRSAGQTQQ